MADRIDHYQAAQADITITLSDDETGIDRVRALHMKVPVLEPCGHDHTGAEVLAGELWTVLHAGDSLADDMRQWASELGATVDLLDTPKGEPTIT